MKFGVLHTLQRFVLHTLQRNITHLAVITRKSSIKLGFLKEGNWKRANFFKLKNFFQRFTCINAFFTAIIDQCRIGNSNLIHAIVA